MKRAIIWMLLLTAAMNVAMAQKKNPYRSERQEKVWTDRKAWFNFAYGKQSLKIDKGDICLHSDWGESQRDVPIICTDVRFWV